MSLRVLAAAVLLLATIPACRARSADATAPAPSAPAPAPSAPAPALSAATSRVAPAAPVDTREALVWMVDAKGAPTTRWIAASPAGAREVGSKPALLVAVGADVWRWSARAVEVPTVACEGYRPDLTTHRRDGLRGTMERLGSAERVEIIEPWQPEGAADVAQSVDLEGSAGPYVFVREHDYAYTCDALGAHHGSLVVWDLAQRRAVDVLDRGELEALDTAERAEAVDKLLPFDHPLQLEDVTYRATLPRHDARGALLAEHEVSTFACTACSDGQWGSNTRWVAIPARHLPARLAPYERPAAVVTSWLAAHPRTGLAGWSPVSPEAARVLAEVMKK